MIDPLDATTAPRPLRPRVRLAPGTHAITGLKGRGDWYHDGSDFCRFFGDHGIDCVPFHWPTALAGFEFWLPWFGFEPNLGDWEIPAVHAKEIYQPSEVDPVHWPRPSRVHWVGHSHAAQPLLMACAMGLRINLLVTVCSPVRVDVLERYGPRARKNIGYHLHYWSVGDRVQAAGAVGDSYFGTLREFTYIRRSGEVIYRADEHIQLPEVCGHSGLLHRAEFRAELLTAIDRIRSRDGRDDLMPARKDAPP